MPTMARAAAGLRTSRSLPVAFQYPVLVARFVRDPVAYLRSRKLKKYHSLAVSLAASDQTSRETISQCKLAQHVSITYEQQCISSREFVTGMFEMISQRSATGR
jgi:hypothetical protein